ncbi:MAG TPA: class I SAM-dependent methyltransferase [Candidatus Elarobacter sp.]|jgi:hypothetical protein|nr:class I SAM-dependent methyltransferase [Candidatus Elarobacter sp.]
MTDVSDFQRESYRIDQQIWDALGLRSGERALFLGFANDGAWAARAAEIGVDVTVLASSDAQLERIDRIGATPMRGSATMIGAPENAYDVAIAMHYLHEIDPGFHARVVSEMARVARRVAIVEPSPPADALGKRIAALYGRAKRESGQFENYQPIEYWRKLLSIVKADVWQNLFTFTRVPPKHAVAETVSLILDAMAIEEMPQGYLDELRALASRRDAQLLPLSRIVLVGTAAGVPLAQGNGTPFRPNVSIAPSPPPPRETPAAAVPAPPVPPPPAPLSPTAPAPSRGDYAIWPPEGNQPAQPPPGFGFEPPAQPPLPAGIPPQPAPPAAVPPPFGAPFALPEEPSAGDELGDAAPPASGFGWSWEPPEEEPPKPA